MYPYLQDHRVVPNIPAAAPVGVTAQQIPLAVPTMTLFLPSCDDGDEDAMSDITDDRSYRMQLQFEQMMQLQRRYHEALKLYNTDPIEEQLRLRPRRDIPPTFVPSGEKVQTVVVAAKAGKSKMTLQIVGRPRKLSYARRGDPQWDYVSRGGEFV